MEGNKRVRRRRRNTVERLKNLLILLLTLSAVVLTVRVLMFNGLVDKGPGWLDHLLSLLNPGQSVPADAPEATDRPEPPPSPCVLPSAMGWTALRFSMTQPTLTACSVR